jgi:hypothetical protein
MRSFGRGVVGRSCRIWLVKWVRDVVAVPARERVLMVGGGGRVCALVVVGCLVRMTFGACQYLLVRSIGGMETRACMIFLMDSMV